MPQERPDQRAVTAADPYQFAAVVPAQPGFFVLTVWAEAGGDMLANAHPVIAWRVPDAGYYAVPITVDLFSNEPAAIEMPNGRVVDQGGGQYASRADWLEAHRPIIEAHPAQSALL